MELLIVSGLSGAGKSVAMDALEDMLVFDAIICNTDRHYGNFGVLVDNKTNTIAAPAPLFDHGNSLFSLGGTDLWDNQKAFDEYARTLLPLAYDDFFAAAKSAMKPRHRAMLQWPPLIAF